MIDAPPNVEVVRELANLGFSAFTTTRQFGSLGTATDQPVHDVMARWQLLVSFLRNAGIPRLATASQVHGARVLTHKAGWEGWLRAPEADGHVCAADVPTAAAVTVADCVPVFLAHPAGSGALLHSGWRGTEARMVEGGIDALAAVGCRASELTMHLGPAICGKCYEVSPDVYGRLTGRRVDASTCVDLRGIIAEHAAAHGVRTISMSPWCTRCDNARFYSHRAGDTGRQVSVIARIAPPSA